MFSFHCPPLLHVQHAASRVSTCKWTRHVTSARCTMQAQMTHRGTPPVRRATNHKLNTRQGSHSLLSASDSAVLLQQHLVCSRHCQHLVLTVLVHSRGLSFSSHSLDTAEESWGVSPPVGVWREGFCTRWVVVRGVVKSGHSFCMCTLSEHCVTRTYSPLHATA